MSERSEVLWDELQQLGGPDVLAELLAARPELWRVVPRDAQVALPWEETPTQWVRFGAGAVCGLPIDIAGGRPALKAAVVWQPWHTERLWRASSLSGHRRGSDRLVHRKSPEAAPFSSPEDGQRWCDETLTAAGWVLL